MTATLLVGLLSLGALGCAAKGPLPRAQVAALTAVEVMEAIRATERQAYEQGLVSQDQHRQTLLVLLDVLDVLDVYVGAVEAWTEGRGSQVEVEVARSALRSRIPDLQGLLPTSMGSLLTLFTSTLGGA